jgi:integrase
MSTDQIDKSAVHSRCGKFQKVGENLYRYSSSEIYYGVFRVRGKLKWKSLKTTDKSLAKRRLAEELTKASKIDSKAGRMNLEALVQIYEETIQTFDKKTIQTRRSIAKKFKETWQFGLGMQVADVTQTHLEIWLGLHRERLRKSSYNEYIRFLRHLLANAVKSRAIAESPAAVLTELKRENPVRISPTWEQFTAIVSNIRGLAFVDAEASAELVEFMGLAGVGTAEADTLMGEHIDFQAGNIRLYRSKTDQGFKIPIFPQVRPLLEKLRNAGRIKNGQRVFRIRDPKKALKNACKRLGYPHFTPRSLRRCFITRAIELGVDFKTIAAWQGHGDGGVLIARTYSHLRDDHAKSMAILMKPPVS